LTKSAETIAVVVVTYNSEDVVGDLVASLPAGLAGLDWHLTVADNDSTDQTLKVLAERAPGATVVEVGRNAGYAAGINAAIAGAPPHDAVLVLNPDIRLVPGSVARLVDALHRNPGAGIAVPRINQGDGLFTPSMRREPRVLRALADALLGGRRAGRFALLGEVVTDEREYDAETVTDWAEGSALLIGAECLRRCGAWDDSFFLYSEETEYMLRARDLGLSTVFVPDAVVIHLGGNSRTSPPLWAMLTVNRARLYRRRHGVVRGAAYWSALMLRELIRSALGNACSRLAVRWLLRPSVYSVPFPAGAAAPVAARALSAAASPVPGRRG
jgi:N-acetylglucosaminyl-diphospho-decaprenol L-rhamnosyltransferase